jgi:hypothetical protein
VKIQDFGLWFRCRVSGEWSTTIYEKAPFHIYYDGVELGFQDSSFDLTFYSHYPHKIQLKKYFYQKSYSIHCINRQLTLDDFEIIENVDYKDYYENS